MQYPVYENICIEALTDIAKSRHELSVDDLSKYIPYRMLIRMLMENVRLLPFPVDASEVFSSDEVLDCRRMSTNLDDPLINLMNYQHNRLFINSSKSSALILQFYKLMQPCTEIGWKGIVKYLCWIVTGDGGKRNSEQDTREIRRITKRDVISKSYQRLLEVIDGVFGIEEVKYERLPPGRRMKSIWIEGDRDAHRSSETKQAWERMWRCASDILEEEDTCHILPLHIVYHIYYILNNYFFDFKYFLINSLSTCVN